MNGKTSTTISSGLLREIVASWFAADEVKIAHALKDGLLIEVQDGKEGKEGSGKEG